MNQGQLERMKEGKGFIAALDQSGGSTPKALKNYGISEDAYSNEDEMFDLIHEMRTRIITSEPFSKEKILGAILFKQTVQRTVEGKPTGQYLWEEKGIVPFIKVDLGLDELKDGVKLMKPITDLDETLKLANEKGMFGTKMRSVIYEVNEEGIKKIVAQQFEYAKRILDAGLMPIVEPEVDIHCEEKAKAEELLKKAVFEELEKLPEGKKVMLKLTIPTVPDFYSDLIADERVLRVVALSGGYSREQSIELLEKNHGLIASFSRALTEGLSADQSDEDFTKMLGDAIASIYDASII